MIISSNFSSVSKARTSVGPRVAPKTGNLPQLGDHVQFSGRQKKQPALSPTMQRAKKALLAGDIEAAKTLLHVEQVLGGSSSIKVREGVYQKDTATLNRLQEEATTEKDRAKLERLQNALDLVQFTEVMEADAKDALLRKDVKTFQRLHQALDTLLKLPQSVWFGRGWDYAERVRRLWVRGPLDLKNFDLNGVNLKGINLAGANLEGAKLAGANLNGVDLTDADLNGVDLTDADLTNATANGATFCGANLTGTNFQGSNLNRARFDDKTNFTKTTFMGASLHHVDLKGADLRTTHLQNVNLYKSDLTGANLAGVELTDAKLAEATFDKANMRGACLRWSYLRNADFFETDLRKANLQGTDIAWTNFQAADLTQADFRGATFITHALFTAGTKLGGAIFDFDFTQKQYEYFAEKGADLSAATFYGKKLLKPDCDANWVGNPNAYRRC